MAEEQASAEVATTEVVGTTTETTPDAATHAADAAPICLTVKWMSGSEVVALKHLPSTVLELKEVITEATRLPVALQKLLREQGFAVCSNEEALEADVTAGPLGFFLVQDETPYYSWDLEGNPSKWGLEIEGSVIKCPQLQSDYSNVVTREPVSKGLHYFEFVLVNYGDEQWCGLTPSKDMAGPEHDKAIPSKNGYMYYTGRKEGAIEAMGNHLGKAKFVNRSDGSVIGMLVDCDNGAVAFDVNGEVQGACEIPKATPMWLLTHVDTRKDHIELRKPCLDDAPPAHFDALKGALLQVSQGKAMNRSY